MNIAFWVTLCYFLVEMTGGLFYNSLALLTDASFMVINVAGQLLVLYTDRVSSRLPDRRKTFGYERAKVISALFNGMLIGFVIFYVFRDAYDRILHPAPIQANKVFFISLIGLVANAYTVLCLHGRARDIHVRGAYLLALNDALGSVGITISALLVHLTNLYIIDSITSLIISLLIAYPTYRLVINSIGILMESVPSWIDIGEVEGFIYEQFSNISKVKELHVWAISPEKIIATIEIRTQSRSYSREKIKALKHALKNQFGFYKTYLEVYEDSNNNAASCLES